MRILTGANAEFYRCLCQLLLSVRRHHEPTRCRVYNLGLERRQAANLSRRFPDFAVRDFEFEGHPPHVHIDAHTYAWKPLIIARELETSDEPVLWLDAATVVRSPLAAIETEILENGQYVPISGNMKATVERWTHPTTLEKLGTPSGQVRTMHQRAGGVCGFDAGNPVVRKLVRRWKDLAMREDVIAPPGSNRSNHRHDQAILTLLLIEAAQCDGIRLTHHEIDVGSSCPIRWLSVRNKVPNSVPIFLDPLIRLAYHLHRWKKRRDHRAQQKGQARSNPA